MKAAHTILLGALVFSVFVAAGPASGGGQEVLVGELSYTPPPEVSICFCGSYLLAGEPEPKAVYLVSESIDLSPYVGLRITVHGRSFTGLCSGTLARSCDFFAVEKVAAAVRADAEGATWGAIKSLYR